MKKTLTAVKVTARELLETALETQVAEENLKKAYVYGVADVSAGYLPSFPITIYNISGDDTSGIAGLLRPNGEFVRTNPPLTSQDYWEFDETHFYQTNPFKVLESDRIAVGNSWSMGSVFWDGSVAGDISLELDGDETDGSNERNLVNRRTVDRSITGDWISTGELWRALERGTGMQGGPVPGKIHRSF